VGVVLMDVGPVEETQLLDLEPVPDGSSLLAWRNSEGQTVLLALPADVHWEVNGDNGSWVVQITFDGPATFSLDVQEPHAVDWIHGAGHNPRMH